MRGADLAIDLGTSVARVAARGRGLLLAEPSVVALRVDGRGREVEATGEAARAMIDRNPEGIEVVRPVRGGAVADFDATELLLHHLLSASTGRGRLLRPRVLLPVPTAATEVERRAVQDAARSAGARDAVVLPAPLVSALGAGLAIEEPTGRLVVELGAGATQIAVICLGGIVVERSLRMGGEDLDEALALWLRSRKGVTVGLLTAESIRKGLPQSGRPVQIRARDAQTGRPREIEITATDLVEAVSEVVTRLRDGVLQTLSETPPELSADLLERGIVLCGGLAQFNVIGSILKRSTGLSVARAAQSETCVIRGASLLLDNPSLLQRVADLT